VHNTFSMRNSLQQYENHPPAWANLKLRDCIDILDNQRVPVNSEAREKRTGKVPYYGATGQVGWIDNFLFDEELLLLGEDGAPFFDKSKSISYIIDGKSWVNNHAHVLRAKFEITSNAFLKHFLDYFDFTGYVTGTTRLKLNQSSMKEIPVVLPPINEQNRIVDKLEKLLGKVEQCKVRLEKIPIILKRFRQSVLAAACSGELTKDWRKGNPAKNDINSSLKEISKKRRQRYDELCIEAHDRGEKKPKRPVHFEPRISSPDNELPPNSWFWTSIEDLASVRRYSLSSGPFGSVLGRKDYRESGIPIVRGKNIQNGKFVSNNFVLISEEKAHELERSTGYPGDILVVAVGSSGSAAIIPDSLPICVLSQNCNKVSLDQDLAIPEYINYFLQIEIAISQLRERTTDTARPFLSLTNLKKTLVPVPPLEEQQEIVSRVEALFKVADRIEFRYKKARVHVDKLAQSILAKAFRGELVPQDPNDEPASKLLERIRAGREKSDAVKPKRTRADRKPKPEKRKTQPV